MFTTSLRRRFFARAATRRSAPASAKTRLSLTNLEERAVPATFTVTNVNDSGAGSLRQALADAKSAGGTDTIVFGAAFNSGGTINLSSSLSLDSEVTIKASSDVTKQVVINGQSSTRVFDLSGSNTVTLEFLGIKDGAASTGAGVSQTAGNLTLIGCEFNTNSATSHGGSIYLSSGTLTLDGTCVLNSISDGNGGGIYMASGQLTISSSAIVANTASATSKLGGGVCIVSGNATISASSISLNMATNSGEGGGIYNTGTLTVTKSQVTANSAYNAGGISSQGKLTVSDGSVISLNRAVGAYGGGILAETSTVTITIEDSTVADNSANTGNGGGIVINGPSLALTDSTVARNQTSLGNGGGIAFFGGGDLSIANSTISSNTAGSNGGGLYVDATSIGDREFYNSTVAFNKGSAGGGIRFNGTTASVTLDSNIVAKNVNASGRDDVNGSADSSDFNLVGDATGFTVTPGASDIFGDATTAVDPQLGPLSNYGGRTETHVLLAGSPAIETGNNSLILTNDQRGTGYVREYGLPDIGAYERQPPRVAGILINGGESQLSRNVSLRVYFSEPVHFDTGANVANTFTLVPNGGGTSVTLNSSGFTGNYIDFTYSGNHTFQFDPVNSDGKYSLTEGRYQLDITGGNVLNDSNVAVDGDGNGTPGGTHVRNDIVRHYGDSNGDGFVDNVDFVVFRTTNGTAFGNPLHIIGLDSNGDGYVDNVDFVAFRNNIGTTI